MKFSVVMSTYAGETCGNLSLACASLYNQTYKPDEIILVVDGPVSHSLRITIDKQIILYQTVKVIWLLENVGRGQARNIGILNSQFNIIAIMDSDDIARPNRFERSIKIMQEKNVDLICSLQQEFDDKSDTKLGIKWCPQNDIAIKKALRFSCVISNPTTMFCKSFWEKAGGYPLYKDSNEDYLFFLRGGKQGLKFYCIQEPLLDVRISNAQRLRRSGLTVFNQDVIFRKACVKEGHHSFLYAIYILSIYAVKRLSPPKFQFLLNKLWRK